MGSNTYFFGRGSGSDFIAGRNGGSSTWSILQFKEGVLPSDIIASQNTDGHLIISIAGTSDLVMLGGFFWGETISHKNNAVQEVLFADGTRWSYDLLKAKAFTGGAGNDSITATSWADLLFGGAGNDTLNGGAGNDILQGGEGADTLTDNSGTALFNGGVGNDTITGGASAEVFIGGAGNDVYTLGGGNDVILFNKGDGQDVVVSQGASSGTLSLGGQFAYSDLSFAKSNNDLVLKMGSTDQISFQNWYAASPVRPVVNLQVIAETMQGFSAGGSDALLDQKVENFNLTGLVSAFDTARVANSGLLSWSLMNALSQFQLAGSDSAAIGSDIAYGYGKEGTLSGMGLSIAQNVINDPNLGKSRTLSAPELIQTGAMRLS